MANQTMTGNRILMNPRMLAVQRAVAAYDEIRDACTRPDKAISGETLEIYNELVDWGFVEKYPISVTDHKWLYVVFIAMHLNMEAKYTEKSDSYTSENKSEKWKLIQSALEKASNSKKP